MRFLFVLFEEIQSLINLFMIEVLFEVGKKVKGWNVFKRFQQMQFVF